MSKCEPWCGNRFVSSKDAQGAFWHGFGSQMQRAYCTAACLERAREKPAFVPYAKLPDGLHAPGLLDHVTKPVKPVDIAAPKPDVPVYPKPQENPFPGGTPVWPPAPVCAGPLATHGVAATYPGTNQPVGVCVAGWSKLAGKDCGPAVARVGLGGKNIYTCDICCLEWEKYVERQYKPVSHEPPARIGTVPQAFGLNVGVWASRGMRRL